MIDLFKKLLINSIPDINDLCEMIYTENVNTKSHKIDLEPNNKNGQESMCILIYETYITISYDYYEQYFNFDSTSKGIIFQSVVDIVSQILKEELLAVTTFHNINTSRVPILIKPDKAKRISRKSNYRARSWLGTYDENRPQPHVRNSLRNT